MIRYWLRKPQASSFNTTQRHLILHLSSSTVEVQSSSTLSYSGVTTAPSNSATLRSTTPSNSHSVMWHALNNSVTVWRDIEQLCHSDIWYTEQQCQCVKCNSIAGISCVWLKHSFPLQRQTETKKPLPSLQMFPAPPGIHTYKHRKMSFVSYLFALFPKKLAELHHS